ncbi:galactose oxidase [Maribacter polysiphoniae]|uniref:Galactose oxidase n=1 Tax=Maribacter polysiphoniae TaxID=429344 RepID=A0A316DX66_9FLAO|nr:kelch repeat-containing protein [Maribacter polysiphoniae]MBD1262606.1 galactose oxidase [Maribacter polysiphoniae]PWK21193.1 Kelch motif protein [Maribacter polysiphoniae]
MCKIDFSLKFRLPFVLFLTPFFLCSQTTETNGGQWIDKNESENYTARHECSFVQAGDTFILLGGRESAQTLELYDFKNNTWKKAVNSAPKEFNHFQATFYKGFVWIIGAFKTNSFPREIPEEAIWLYHPPTDQWIKGPEIPEDRRRGGAGLVVYNDVFYIVGGNTIGHDGGYVNWFDAYDPKDNSWTVLENASQKRDHFHAAVLDDVLYAAGGRQSGGEGGVFSPLVGVVDIYDFKTNKWSTLKNDLPTPRAAPGIIVYDNELFVMGGEGEKKGPAFNIVEAYNPNTGSWTDKAPMHYPRHGTQAILSGEGIYIAAGSPTRGGGNQHHMEVYHKDQPSGQKLIASELVVPKKVKIKPGSTKTITVHNKNGNTGSFITSIALSGATKRDYKIHSKSAYFLVDTDGQFDIVIEHLGSASKEKARLEIVYNGNLKKTIALEPR